jgi:hypothetical protein
MPYLFRRAAENTSVAGQASREFTLIKRDGTSSEKIVDDLLKNKNKNATSYFVIVAFLFVPLRFKSNPSGLFNHLMY